MAPPESNVGFDSRPKATDVNRSNYLEKLANYVSKVEAFELTPGKPEEVKDVR